MLRNRGGGDYNTKRNSEPNLQISPHLMVNPDTQAAGGQSHKPCWTSPEVCNSIDALRRYNILDSRYGWLSSPRVGGGGWDAAHHGHVLHGGEVTENLHVGGV